MLQALFHAWERRLAAITTDRVVRPFEWGLDWIPANGHAPGASPADVVAAFAAQAMADSEAFYAAPATTGYTFRRTDDGGTLTFPSALATPHVENNTVHCRYFPARLTGSRDERRPAVLVLPQWNADREGHVGLSRLLAWSGLAALRLALPYHGERMPPELHRADYIVSANVGRTLQVCRQAVLDARRAIAWLAARGHGPIGILGTSLGSCLALLTTAHEPLVRAQALNHVSPYFADVVWRGLSTRHVREGLDGRIDLDALRRLWAPISPQSYLGRIAGRSTLLVYARYDLSFPLDLSERLVRAFAERRIPHEVARLPCGHYSSGKAPFKYVDGWILTRFLKRALTLG